MTEVPPSLEISATPSGIAVVGEIDAHSAPTLKAALAGRTSSTVTVDLSGVEFVDSSGLRVLIEMHQGHQAEGGSMVITQPSATVQRLFEISGVTDYFTMGD